MTIEEMRALTGQPVDTAPEAIVAAYAALIEDGLPSSIVLVEPVTVEMVREQCHVDDELSDAIIMQKVRAAREWAEDYTSRIIAQRTLVAHYRTWGHYLEIFKRPIISIDAIAYNGETADGIYSTPVTALGAYPARIHPDTGGFPRLRAGGLVTVAYTAGYDAGEVPHRMIEAVLVLAAGMLSDREGGYDKSINAAKALLRLLRAPARL